MEIFGSLTFAYIPIPILVNLGNNTTIPAHAKSKSNSKFMAWREREAVFLWLAMVVMEDRRFFTRVRRCVALRCVFR